MHSEKEFILKNKLGLHVRAAAQLVKLANRFSSQITIYKGNLKADAKSILDLLTLAAAKNTTIKVTCQGSDAKDSLNAIENLIKNEFHEV